MTAFKSIGRRILLVADIEPALRMIDLIDYLARVTAIGGREIQDQAM